MGIRRKFWKGYAGYTPLKPQHMEIDGQPACLSDEYKIAFLGENDKGRKMKHQPWLCFANTETDVRLLLGIGEEVQELMPDAVVGWEKGNCPHFRKGPVHGVSQIGTMTGAATQTDIGSWDDEDPDHDPTQTRDLSDKWGTRHVR